MADYACAILINNGRILLGRRAPHRRAYAEKWDVIGGRVEAGETISEALARELREEIDVVPENFTLLCSMLDRNLGGRSGPAIYHMHLITRWSGAGPVLANSEHTELAWYDTEQASRLADLALEDYRPMFRSIAAR